jgi:hypothetical protein
MYSIFTGGNLFYKIGGRGLEKKALLAIFYIRDAKAREERATKLAKADLKKKKRNAAAHAVVLNSASLDELTQKDLGILLAFFMGGRNHSKITKKEARIAKILECISTGVRFPAEPE